jgi:hypothetical protein
LPRGAAINDNNYGPTHHHHGPNNDIIEHQHDVHDVAFTNDNHEHYFNNADNEFNAHYGAAHYGARDACDNDT